MYACFTNLSQRTALSTPSPPPPSPRPPTRAVFLKRRPLTGLVVIYTFWFALIASTYLFFREGGVLAGSLLVPSAVWVAVASALNLDVWWLNRDRA